MLQEIKEAKKQAKKTKLDPESALNTVAVQQRLLAAKPVNNDAPPESSASTQDATHKNDGTALSVSELRERLHAKIAQLQQRRLGSCNSSVASAGSAQRGQSPTNATTASKTRQQILEERQRKKLQQKEAQRQEKMRLNPSAVGASGNKRKHEDNDSQNKQQQQPNLAFSKIDFGDAKKKQKLDPKVALKRVEAEQAKLQQLKQQNSEKVNFIVLFPTNSSYSFVNY